MNTRVDVLEDEADVCSVESQASNRVINIGEGTKTELLFEYMCVHVG